LVFNGRFETQANYGETHLPYVLDVICFLLWLKKSKLAGTGATGAVGVCKHIMVPTKFAVGPFRIRTKVAMSELYFTRISISIKTRFHPDESDGFKLVTLKVFCREPATGVDRRATERFFGLDKKSFISILLPYCSSR
jgi:hypothetical protein